MPVKNHYDFIVIGGGVVGLASTYSLAQRFPEKKILLLEKNPGVSMGQSGNNSGVIHSGIYYPPHSLKAQNCLEGYSRLIHFSKTHSIPHKICGKLILATHKQELPELQKLFLRGKENGLKGIELLNPIEIKKFEPEAKGVGGIWLPQTGVINFSHFCNRLSEVILKVSSGVEFQFNSQVCQISPTDYGVKLETNRGDLFSGERVIVAGGAQADRLALMSGFNPSIRIVPFLGRFKIFSDPSAQQVKGLIYPVPNPKFPFLGVHLTRKIDGTVKAGPNAVFSFSREGDWKTIPQDLTSSLFYRGTWSLFLKFWKQGLLEIKRDLFPQLFFRSCRSMFPKLKKRDMSPGGFGIRAVAVHPDGSMADDFIFQKSGQILHVLHTPSPAATASLAIGEKIVKTLLET